MRVTKDDYYNKFAIDLNIEFRSSNYDNETQAVDTWLENNEEDLIDLLDSMGMTEESDLWNEDELKRALLQQDKHILDNGEIPIKGMKDENGNFIPFLSPKAKRILKKCGMLKFVFSRYGDYYG